MTKTTKNVREAALEVLEKVEKQQSYSNLLLNDVIKKYRITGPDVGLLTEIVYGTIQRKMTLEYYLKPFLKKNPDYWVVLLLHLSLYQMLYLDKIPDRAVLFEAVEIAKKRGHRGIASFVNGILRAIQRKGVPSLDIIEDPLLRLAIETSHPLWLVKRWTDQYGYERAKTMCEKNLLSPVQTARVNTTKASREEVLKLLLAERFDVKASPIIPEGIRVYRGNLAHSNAYRNGFISIQDESSMVVAYSLELTANLNVLDACAAPGGKTGHIAEQMQGTGMVTALDLHPHKVKLIKENAERLGLKNIEAYVQDSRHLSDSFQEPAFDRVLVDAPCSGLGVLRRKPDIKYSKNEDDIEALKNIQMTLLNECAKLVKPGGLLVYSTCTVDQEENVGTVQRFLDQQEDFQPHSLTVPSELNHFKEQSDAFYLQIFPQDFDGDGFFIACFKKV